MRCDGGPSPLLVIAGCAAILRLAAAANDLWFDEIWSLWLIASEAQAPWDLFRGGMRHDNNHLLNSLYLFWLPPHLPPLTYRPLRQAICDRTQRRQRLSQLRLRSHRKCRNAVAAGVAIRQPRSLALSLR